MPKEARYPYLAAASIGLALWVGRLGPDQNGRTTDPRALARQQAETEYQRGMRFLDGGQAAQAVGAFEKALELDPEYHEPQLGLARAYAELADFPEAERAANAYLEGKPGEIEGLLLWARLSILAAEAAARRGEPTKAQGLYEQAVERFTRVVTAFPSEAKAYRGRSVAYERLGKSPEMISDRKKAEELEKRATGGVLDDVRKLYLAGQLVEAMARIEPLLAERPDDPALQLLNGQILEAQGAAERALAAYSIAASADPADRRYRVARARALVALGQYRAAGEELGALSILVETGDEAVFLQGRVAEGEGFLAEALVSYDAAARGTWLSEAGSDGDRRHADLSLRRGRVRFRLDDVRGAIADLDRAVDLAPGSVEALFLRGACRVELGDLSGIDAAAKDLQGSIDGGCESPTRAKIYLGRVSLLQGHAEEALAAFDEVAKVEPGLPDVYLFRAQAHLALDRRDAALEDARTALRLDPFRARHHRMKGTVELASEEYQAAEASFRKGLDLDVNDFDNLLGVFRSLVGQGDFGRVLDLEAFIQDTIETSWQETINLFEPQVEEVRAAYLDRREARREEDPELEERRVEGCFWAVGQEDRTVREAGVEGLIGVGLSVLARVRERKANATGVEREALQAVEDGIAGLEERARRQRVVTVLAQVYLGKERAALEHSMTEGELALESLVAIVGDGEEGVAARRLAARALVDLRDAPALAAAQALLESDAPSTRALGAAALADGGFVVRRERLTDLLDSADPLVRGLAVLALPGVPAAKYDLVEALSDPDQRVRLHAAARLAQTGSEEALDVLLTGRESGDPRARRMSLRALTLFTAHPLIKGPLIRSLADEDPIVRRDAAIALGRLGAVESRTPLVNQLGVEHRRDVKAQILLALTEVPDDSISKALRPVLFDRTQDPIVRGAAFFYYFRNSLLDAGLAMQLPKLFSKDEDWVIRSVAMVVTGMEIPENPLVGGLLLQGLQDPDDRIRGSAAAGVCKSALPQVNEQLEKLLDTPSAFVRGAAAGALVFRAVLGRFEPGDDFAARIARDDAVRKGVGAAYYRMCIWRGELPGDTEEEIDRTRARLLAKAIELCPEMPVYPIEFTEVLFRLDRGREALPFLLRAVETNPGNLDLRLYLALVLRLLGRSADAVVAAERVVKADPRNVRAWYQLGWAKMEELDAPGAADALLACWRLGPADEAIHGLLSEAFLGAKRYVQLLPILDDAAYRWPDAAEIHWYRARALAGAGDADRAIEALREARRTSYPDIADAKDVPEFASLRKRPDFESLVR